LVGILQVAYIDHGYFDVHVNHVLIDNFLCCAIFAEYRITHYVHSVIMMKHIGSYLSYARRISASGVIAPRAFHLEESSGWGLRLAIVDRRIGEAAQRR